MSKIFELEKEMNMMGCVSSINAYSNEEIQGNHPQ